MFALLVLVALTSLTAAQMPLTYSYQTTLSKGPANLNLVLRSSPDGNGKCRIHFTQRDFCSEDTIPISVRITVIDQLPYAEIVIDNLMEYAIIQRVPDADGHCGGTLSLTLETYCVGKYPYEYKSAS